MELVRGRLDVLLNLTAGLAERMDIRSIADFVLGVGRDAIEANRGTLCLITPDGDWLEVVAQVGYDTDMMSVWQRFSLADPLPASDAVRTASAVYLHDPQERARRYPMFADTGGDGASVMLPLLVRERAIGSLVFGFDGERSFDADDQQFLNALSTQCAIALDRARLYEQSLRRQANLALLVDASAVLAAARDDIEEGLSRLAPKVAPTVCDIFSVRLLSVTRSTRLVARAFSESTLLAETERVSDFGADFWAKDGLGRALRTGREVVWDDGDRFIERIARDDEHRQALEAMELGAGIIVP